MYLLILGAVLISFSPVFVKLAEISPDASSFYRMAVGGAGLIGVLALRGELRLINRRMLGWGLVAAAFFLLDIMCWHRSILAIGPGPATMMANFQVVILAAVSVLVLGEGLAWRFFASLPLAGGGLWLIAGRGILSGDADVRAGVVYGLGAACFYAAYLLTLKRMVSGKTGQSALAAVAAVSVMTAGLAAGLLAAKGVPFALPTPTAWACMLAYGLLCQCAGWFLITTGMQRTAAAKAGLALLLQPSLSYVWDVWFFAKPVGLPEAAGVGLALAGIWLGMTARSR